MKTPVRKTRSTARLTVVYEFHRYRIKAENENSALNLIDGSDSSHESGITYLVTDFNILNVLASALLLNREWQPQHTQGIHSDHTITYYAEISRCSSHIHN